MFWKKSNDRSEALEEEFLAAKVKLKELEFEKKNLKQELELEKRKIDSQMRMAKSEFQQEKSLWNKSKDVEISNLKGQLVTKFEQDKAAIKAEFDTKLVKAEAKLNEEFYSKMTEALNDLHTKGNHSTKFVQDIAMKMMDRQKPQVEYIEEE